MEPIQLQCYSPAAGRVNTFLRNGPITFSPPGGYAAG